MASKARTKLDLEKQAKKQQAEAQEYLDQITEEGETGEIKAASIITQKGNEAEKASREDEARKVEELEKSRKWTKKEYVRRLAQTMNEMAKHMDLPSGYSYWISFGETKLNIIITAPDGRKFGRGIVPTGMTTYDFHACGVLLTQCENTVDKLEQRGEFSQSNIIVPK